MADMKIQALCIENEERKIVKQLIRYHFIVPNNVTAQKGCLNLKFGYSNLGKLEQYIVSKNAIMIVSKSDM